MYKIIVITLLCIFVNPAQSLVSIKLGLLSSSTNGLESPWGTCELLKHREINRFTDSKEVSHQLKHKKIKPEELLQITKVSNSVYILKEELDRSKIEIVLNYEVKPSVATIISKVGFESLEINFDGHGRAWESPVNLFSDNYNFSYLDKESRIELKYKISLRQYCDYKNELPTVSVIVD